MKATRNFLKVTAICLGLGTCSALAGDQLWGGSSQGSGRYGQGSSQGQWAGGQSGGAYGGGGAYSGGGHSGGGGGAYGGKYAGGQGDAYSLGKAVLYSNEQIAKCRFIEATAGAAFGVKGYFTRKFKGTFNGFDSYLDRYDFNDVYDVAGNYGLRLGTCWGAHNVYLGVDYTEAGGSRVPLGEAGDDRVYGDFGRYRDFGVFVGIEREFWQPARIHPYLGFQAGARFVDSIHATFVTGHVSSGNVRFYDDTTVFTAAVTVGCAYDVTDCFQIGIESGLRYQTSMNSADNDFTTIADEDDLYFVPVMLTGAFYF